ncbi:MAG: hypothetical protein V4539_24090 [Bacteroidota bacterium]
MKRFWFEFEVINYQNAPIGIGYECGVTAHNVEDAMNMLKTRVFSDKPKLQIKKIIEDADVSTLDAGHVLPNMNPPNWRGIWFPNCYD